MDLIPAIDLLDGRAVRLVQGDYARRAATIGDPLPVVRDWLASGVRWLHVVDLGGARAGRPRHLEMVRRLATAARVARADACIELGGGLRRIDDLAAAFEAGVDVAILGTAAIEDPQLLVTAVDRWPDRVAASIDVRGDRVAVDGWTRSTARDAVRLAMELAERGAAQIVVTDVERDGTHGGVNQALLVRMRDAVPGTRLVAAGGIGTVADLRRLAGLGLDGAVVGLALVDGSLSIVDALAAADGRAIGAA